MSTFYTVKSGDSLTKISMALYGTYDRWAEIAQLNNIQGPDYVIQPGQNLVLPDSTGAGTEADPRVINQGITIKAPPTGPSIFDKKFMVMGFEISMTQIAIIAGGLLGLYIWSQNQRKGGKKRARKRKAKRQYA